MRFEGLMLKDGEPLRESLADTESLTLLVWLMVVVNVRLVKVSLQEALWEGGVPVWDSVRLRLSE
jgi:hypothetical protein